jgi:hypothetical protein
VYVRRIETFLEFAEGNLASSSQWFQTFALETKLVVIYSSRGRSFQVSTILLGIGNAETVVDSFTFRVEHCPVCLDGGITCCPVWDCSPV